MKIKEITPLTWKRFAVSVAIIITAAALRIWPLQSLGISMAWLTYYPAVMVAGIFGGLFCGLLATFLSAFIVVFLWSLIVTQPYVSKPADWLGVAVFTFTCTMISFVTEAMREANRRSLEAQSLAQNANRAKSEFLANMSHELRTPLNAILGYSQMMQEDTSLSKEHNEFLKIINRSGEHLLELINEVLEISKIEAKRVSIDLLSFNLHNLILDLQKMFELKTGAKGLLFKMIGINELPLVVITDATKLRIILINLIGNAIKFTQSGSVVVRFDVCKDSPDEEFLMIEVEDTGPGIAENEKEKLFKYFMQTETGKISKSGTGLGLAISQDYAKLLGGEIGVISSPGSGSKFNVRIKITEGKEEDINEKLHQKKIFGLAPGQHIPKVLVAEDLAENRNLLVKALKSIGLTVREAVNGREVVEIFKEWEPDFIWMDIRMPEMDGLEATRIIKATELGKRTKIVAVSAHVLGEKRKEIFAAGCDDFVGKPFKMNELFDVMEKHLALKYTYESKQSEKDDLSSTRDKVLNLSSVDNDLLFELNKAVICADAIRIKEIAEEIEVKDPELGMALNACAKNYDYESIRIALQNNPNEEV
jgi:signal transduction histidine kinase/FixJ family two-component response regulator